VTRLIHRFMNKRLATGVDRVSLAYIRHYGPRARAVLRHNGGKFVFRRAESATLFDWLLSLGTTGSPMPTIYKGLVAGCLLQRVTGRFLFNTGHNGLESDDYVTMLRQQQVRPIFMVHDLIPITHPQYCRAGEQAKHMTRLRNAMRVASGIMCNSQATMNALVDLCADNKWAMPPAAVALLAPELPDATQTARPIAQPYFVFVSTIEPRKNHLMILKVWQKLAAQLGELVPRLVIIGQRGWDYTEVTNLLEHSEVLQGLVTEIPACSDAEMVTYLQHAQALLFPSFTEGYGMPVAEALALGTPVIASDLAVFREFAGNIPDYLDVTDEALWVKAIVAYTGPYSLPRLAQLERMKSFETPTWKRHFARVDALLEQLADSKVLRG
jgi:glycosyltransferase involved in cell wall biosynthesis